MSKPKLLLIDDDLQVLESMADWLESEGYQVDTASDATVGLGLLERVAYQVVLTDLRLGEESGLDLLAASRRKHRHVPVILLTGYADVDTGIEAIRAGAFDLLKKPLLDEELAASIQRALAWGQALPASPEVPHPAPVTRVIGAQGSLRASFQAVEQVADTKATILLTGESGTGKSLMARTIHQQSSRRDRPFVEVACGALSDTLLESELFGHVAGAFTGAVSSKQGKFAMADGGTLFLDEILTASPRMQVKLLRVLQEFAFEPVGDTQTRRVDTRVILATNEDLAEAVRDGRFRQDLYYRINVINLEMPPLRRRREDVAVLCEYFRDQVVRETGKRSMGFSTEAMDILRAWSWPGNVRELQNVVERAVLLCAGTAIEPGDLPLELQHSPDGGDLEYRPGQTLKEAMERPEREIIRQVLDSFGGNRNQTADALGINRTTLYKKMKRLGLDADNALVGVASAEILL